MFDLSPLDDVRRARGLLTIGEVIALNGRGNVVFDPFSVLVSSAVRLGTGNVLHPGVSLLVVAPGRLRVGDGNVLHAGTLIEATLGEISIGDDNAFGEGGFTARVNRDGAAITIGNGGRYLDGARVFGRSRLGAGSQILGPITADDCVLEAGGSFRDTDPDARAGLLKGHGTARGLTVPRGHVIVGAGVFDGDRIERQSAHHPRPAAGGAGR